MSENHLFSSTQNGYLKGRSTTTAIFQFISEIVENIENKIPTMGIFLDLPKAYDCRNHQILFKKLENYGIRGNAAKWIKSYLSGRL